ncbi:hypothetical protein OAV67_06485 [Alphaproteobacteria bacterium]|nr:hypothetical protein [Alphaproteobacteria bacterium]
MVLMNYALNNQNQNRPSLRILLFLTTIAFFGSIPVFELSAAVWKNSSSTTEKKSPDKTLNKSEVIQTFDVFMKTEMLQGLKRLPWAYDFSSKDVWKDLKKDKCFFSLSRRVIENKRIELLASGAFSIENGKIIFGSNSWKTGGMSSPEYLKNESNLRVLRNGIPIGKIPFFLLFTNKGEVARPPKYVELSKQRESGDNERVEGRYSFYVDDWAEGLLDVRNC